MLKEKFKKWVRKQWYRLTGKKLSAFHSATTHYLPDKLKDFLWRRYDFRYNLLSEQAEYSPKGADKYLPADRRALNTLCMEAQLSGIVCWDKDVDRLLRSYLSADYHPFADYMQQLPEWDGTDRITPLAGRLSSDPLWQHCFHRWLLGMAAQWSGQASRTANAFAPLLVSTRQGVCKSTFCKLLIPDTLSAYYTDKFDLTSQSNMEKKLSYYGLINMDEFDRYTPRQHATLKNLLQLTRICIRKPYGNTFSNLPRIASFIGTSNQESLLKDATGSRRFFCIRVEKKIDCTPLAHKQLYAQLRAELEAGMRYWFTAEEEEAIRRHNLPFYDVPPETDAFRLCFRAPNPEEEALELSSAAIYTEIRKRYPAALKGTSPAALSRLLPSLGIERVHRPHGNVYKVVRMQA